MCSYSKSCIIFHIVRYVCLTLSICIAFHILLANEHICWSNFALVARLDHVKQAVYTTALQLRQHFMAEGEC